MQSDIAGSIVGYLVILFGFLFVIGLIRPGFVVWWSDKKTRRAALMVWGVALFISVIAYWTLHNAGKDDPHKYGSGLTRTTLNS